MPLPRHIHQIWLGDKPVGDSALVRTVIEKNPGWKYRLWRDADLWEFGLRAASLRNEFGNWASASNYLRLLILQRHGGIYIDTDFEGLKPMDPFCEFAAVAAEQDEGRICNAFMGSDPHHAWINWQIEHLEDFEKKDAASGVYLATAAPRDGLTIIPSHLVYPWMFNEPEESRHVHPESILQHFWRGSWL